MEFIEDELEEKGNSRRISVCIVTYVPSPYQVEFFNALYHTKQFDLTVVYLKSELRSHRWGTMKLQHRHLVIDASITEASDAWQLCQQVDVVIFNYYTHWFALAALHRRFLSGKPWSFWGERPGFLKLGALGRLGRKLMLFPLSLSNAPIWGVGKEALRAYQGDWGTEKVYVNLPYASDLRRFFNRNKINEDNSTLTILYSGVLTTRKGVLLLAEAFARVGQDHPRLRLLVLGSGPLEASMRELLSPVDKQVTWLGFRTWDQLPSLYAEADVLCLPTSHDGWAMVIPEAMAAEMPVISTDAAGAAIEILQDQVNGWFIPGNQVSDIEKILRELVALPKNALKAAGRAAKNSVEHLDVRAGVKKISTAILQTLDLFSCRVESGEPETTADPAHTSAIQHLFVTSSYAPDELFSMDRYARLVKQAVEGHLGKVHLEAPKPFFGCIRLLPVAVRKVLAHLDKHLIYPFWLRLKICRIPSSEPTVIHVTDQGMGLTIPWLKDFPVVVTVHDLIAYRLATGELNIPGAKSSNEQFQRAVLGAISHASLIISVSQKTLNDCKRLIPGSEANYLHVPSPLEPAFRATEAAPLIPPLPEKYILHVGNNFFYKNRPAVFRIYAALLQLMDQAPKLVMIGSALTFEERKLITTLNLGEHLHFYHSPPDSWLKYAYEHAQALLFPSLEEGFGWPVLEAMAFGCPVFTSNLAPLTEVGGPAAQYIDPSDVQASAALIASSLSKGDGWRRETIAAGHQQASKFNMQTFRHGLLKAYHLALRGNKADQEDLQKNP